MRNWTVSVARWLNAGARFGKPTSRRRGTKRDQLLPVAIEQVERLESRELPTVTFHGGQLLKSVEAQAVYLGSDWNTNASLSSQASSLDQFLSYVVQSPYMDMLTQAGYNVGRGSASTGVIDGININKSSSFSDSQIQSVLQSLAATSQVSTPDANRLYVVYVEPGVVVKNGTDSSTTSFLGYHGAFAGKTAAGKSADFRYEVIPYPGSPNPSPTSQGFSSTFDEMTSVTSHELSEAVTDPDVNYKTLGWYDDQRNGEIGDLTRLNTVLNGYLVQDVVNKNDQPIGPISPTTTLTAPQNVTATALSTTDVRLSWSTVTGATGYRIFLVNGSQATLLGSVNAMTTTTTVTGLTPGDTASFQVEAFNDTAIADSNVVSVVLPTPVAATLTAPQVTAAAVSSTVIRLSWGTVSGAEGYNIYWWDGQQVVFLGTVSASSNSVRVTGLIGGTTNQFLVEAFRGSTVADSNWVSVTTPSPRRNHWGNRFNRWW